MNRDIVEGKWKQLTGRLKQVWGRFAHDDVSLYCGKSEQFYGGLQEKYGLVRAQADKRIKAFAKMRPSQSPYGAVA